MYIIYTRYIISSAESPFLACVSVVCHRLCTCLVNRISAVPCRDMNVCWLLYLPLHVPPTAAVCTIYLLSEAVLADMYSLASFSGFVPYACVYKS